MAMFAGPLVLSGAARGPVVGVVFPEFIDSPGNEALQPTRTRKLGRDIRCVDYRGGWQGFP